MANSGPRRYCPLEIECLEDRVLLSAGLGGHGGARPVAGPPGARFEAVVQFRGESPRGPLRTAPANLGCGGGGAALATPQPAGPAELPGQATAALPGGLNLPVPSGGTLTNRLPAGWTGAQSAPLTGAGTSPTEVAEAGALFTAALVGSGGRLSALATAALAPASPLASATAVTAPLALDSGGLPLARPDGLPVLASACDLLTSLAQTGDAAWQQALHDFWSSEFLPAHTSPPLADTDWLPWIVLLFSGGAAWEAARRAAERRSLQTPVELGPEGSP